MEEFGSFYYIKILSAFIFIIALMYLIGWIVRRYGTKQIGILQQKDSNAQVKLKIIDTVILDYKRRLIVVDFGGKAHMILLGAQSETVVASNIELDKLEEHIENTKKDQK